MQNYIVKCKNCGEPLDLNEGERYIYCRYCGAKNVFDDGTIRIHQTITDEAKIRQVEADERLKNKQMDLEEKRREKENTLRILNKIGLVMMWTVFLPFTLFVYFVKAEKISIKAKCVIIASILIIGVTSYSSVQNKKKRQIEEAINNNFSSRINEICERNGCAIDHFSAGKSSYNIDINMDSLSSDPVDKVQEEIADYVKKEQQQKSVSLSFWQEYSLIRTTSINKYGAVKVYSDNTTTLDDEIINRNKTTLEPIIEEIANVHNMTYNEESFSAEGDSFTATVYTLTCYRKDIDDFAKDLNESLKGLLERTLKVKAYSNVYYNTVLDFSISTDNKITVIENSDYSNSIDDATANQYTSDFRKYLNSLSQFKKPLFSDTPKMTIDEIYFFNNRMNINIQLSEEAKRSDCLAMEKKLLDFNEGKYNVQLDISYDVGYSSRRDFTLNENGKTHEYDYRDFDE